MLGTDEEFVRRVFDGYRVDGFPIFTVHGWKNWERPRRSNGAPLALDDVVFEMIGAKGQLVGLRPQSELEERGIFCPYFHARLYVIYARAAADHDLASFETEKERLTSYKNSRDLARKVAKDLSDLLGKVRAHGIGPTDGYGRSKTDIGQLADAVNRLPDGLEDAVATASAVAEAFERKRADIAPRKGTYVEIWQRYFIVTMGRAWFDLTGREPAQIGGKFHTFVEAASAMIPEYALGRETASDARVRTAVQEAKKLPEWDRWDRSIDPPWIERVSAAEYEARRRALRRKHLQEMAALARRSVNDAGARVMMRRELAAARDFGGDDLEKARVMVEALMPGVSLTDDELRRTVDDLISKG